MDYDVLDLSLIEIAKAIRTRKISSEEVTRNQLLWIDRVQPELNCFISIDGDDAIRAARRADEILARGGNIGALHGVPLAHKDVFYREGKIATGGSKILSAHVQATTATVVTRLASAGALWLGGLNMSEFAANPTGQNEHWGRCANPWNKDFIAGGSSSGSAAAVAARASYASLGSDTGGSIRVPAALCGVVGLKPTQGRVSCYGVLPRAWSHDCVGTLTRTVGDAACLLQVIAGADDIDPTCATESAPDYERSLSKGVKDLRVGVPVNHFRDEIDGELDACMQAALEVLRSVGVRLIKVEFPELETAFRFSTIMTESEAASFHAEWLQTRPQDYSEAVRARIAPGSAISATHYVEAGRYRQALRQRVLADIFTQVDAVCTPVMTKAAPKAVEADGALSGEMRKTVASFTRNTRPISYLGFPAIAIPAGFDRNGIAFGIQLFGRPWSEPLLFRLGNAFQRETGWHRISPYPRRVQP